MNDNKKISYNIDDAYVPSENNVEVYVTLKEAVDNGAIEEDAISLEDVFAASDELLEV